MIRMTRFVAAMTILLLAGCWFQLTVVAQTTTDNTTTAAAQAAPAGAAPQATATPAPTPTPDPLSGISSVIGGATVTGLVDGYYNYNANQPANHSATFQFFDNQTNTFALNLIELGLVKAPDSNSRLGYNITFGFGNAMNVVNSSNNDPSFLQYLKEVYGSYLAPVGKGLQFDFGKFVTPAGAEVIEGNANWNYSRGLLFYNAIPYYHFGLRMKYTFSDKYSLTGFVVNGWNNVTQTNTEGKTGGLSFGWNPNKKVSLTETWLGGPGAVAIENNQWRNLIDTVLTYTPNAKLSLMANGDYGQVQAFTGYNKSVEWYGVAGYLKYQLDPNWAVATRYEYYDDPDGYTTVIGTFLSSGAYVPAGQHIQEVTGTLERKFAQHLTARVEFRHDIAHDPVFARNSNATPVQGQTTVTAGLILALEPNK
jgi:hypothetical protein